MSSLLILYDYSGMELAHLNQAMYWEAPDSGTFYIAVAATKAFDYELTVSFACVTGNAVQDWTTENFWRAVDLAQVQAILTN